ncbi:MAG: O-antigen ligase family protein, partial [Planctomycetota bacterium]|nr:O-antigen ligase family protein [Planctomycetota bacterium]
MLVAVFCALAVAHTVERLARGREWFPVPLSLKLVSLALLAWSAAVVAIDMVLGPARGRAPAVSLREMPFAAAYFGAAVLGASYRVRGGAEGWRGALKAVSAAGMLLALVAFAEYFAGWDVKALLGGADPSPRRFRLSGPYVNPNRFAVLMVVCWGCAAGGAIHGIVSRSARRSRWWTALFLASALAAGTCVGLTLSRLAVISAGIALCLAAAFAVHRAGRVRLWRPEEALTRVEKARLAALAALPVAAMLAWGAWSLSAGEWRLRERFADLAGQDPNVTGRLAAIRAALPLVTERPIIGWGLGMFEPVFAGVQPPELPGRWREVPS